METISFAHLIINHYYYNLGTRGIVYVFDDVRSSTQPPKDTIY